MVIEGYLFTVGWWFFAAWSMVVLVVGWVAFHNDLLSSLSSSQAAAASPQALSRAPQLARAAGKR